MAKALTAADTGIDPKRRYRSWQAHSSPAGVTRYGEIVRGDSAAVAAAPFFFVDHERVSQREEPSPWDKLVEENEEQQEAERAERLRIAKANKIKLEAAPIVRAVRDIVDVERGRTIARGSTVSADDPVAQQFGDAFE